MNNSRFEPARWKGGPLICKAENLPAFETPSDLLAFHASDCPSCNIVEQWQCKACGWWHFDAMAPDPAGSSSGTGRSKGTQRHRLKFYERMDQAEDKIIQRDLRKELDPRSW